MRARCIQTDDGTASVSKGGRTKEECEKMQWALAKGRVESFETEWMNECRRAVKLIGS